MTEDLAKMKDRLTTLSVSGTTAINTTNVTSSGAQTYVGAVTLGAAAVIHLTSTAGGDIAFDSSVDGDLSGIRNLFVDTSGATTPTLPIRRAE